MSEYDRFPDYTATMGHAPHPWRDAEGKPWSLKSKSDLCAECGETPDAHDEESVGNFGSMNESMTDCDCGVRVEYVLKCPLHSDWTLVRREELEAVRDLLANYNFSEDDSGDEGDILTAYDLLRELLGPSTDESVNATLARLSEKP